MAASPHLGFFITIAFAAGVTAADAAVPLRILDTTSRAVFVEIESSSNIDTVGQSFGGPVYPASYSATGGIGTLVISAATHEAMYAGNFPAPVPGSFTPIVIEIDLATRHGDEPGRERRLRERADSPGASRRECSEATPWSA